MSSSIYNGKDDFKQLASKFLVPLFSGASIKENSENSTQTDKIVARTHPCRIHFKPSKEADYRFILKRSQKFSDVQGDDLSEHRIVESFVEVFNEIKKGLQEDYREDLLSSFQRRVIAKSICLGPARQSTSLKIIDQLSRWASKQYEGKPIAAAIGLYRSPVENSTKIDKFDTEDFYSVLSNGYDTIFTVNYTGDLIGHESLLPVETSSEFSPHRQGSIARWTKTKGIAFVLNRLGEISIFKDEKLLFIRRSGNWHFLNHTPLLVQMAPPNNQEVRKAIYETCLDASFAHSGACLGVVTRENRNRWKTIFADKDLLSLKLTEKTKSISKMVAGKKFHFLNRRFRQELAAIDGATVIDHTGKLLSVGAILKIGGGSTGGGRLVAAKALSKFGLGIKVSQDGSIKGFRKRKEIFSIM